MQICGGSAAAGLYGENIAEYGILDRGKGHEACLFFFFDTCEVTTITLQFRKKLLLAGKMTVEEIAETTKLSLEDVMALAGQ